MAFDYERIRNQLSEFSMDIVQELVRRFLASFVEMADELAKEFPQIQTNAWSSPIGSLTEYQGHYLGVECIFPDTTENNGRNVAIILSVKHLTTFPVIDQFDIVGEVGEIETNFLVQELAVNNETLELLEGKLPNLCVILKEAVRRGISSESK